MNCNYLGCPREVYATGLCYGHYRKQRKYGIPERPARLFATKCRIFECSSPPGASGLCHFHFQRRRRDAREVAKERNPIEQSLGWRTENHVARVLSERYDVTRMEHRGSKFDLLLDRKIKVEVKASAGTPLKGSISWRFNIHRHGVLAESCNYYILVCVVNGEMVPHLLVAPLKRLTYQIGSKHWSAFEKFRQDFAAFSKKA